MTEMMTLLLVLSTIIWFVIDRVKSAWSGLKYGKYITIAAAAILGALVVFTYGIDILVALAVTGQVTVIGEILSTLIIMSGSSALSELLELVKVKAKAKD